MPFRLFVPAVIGWVFVAGCASPPPAQSAAAVSLPRVIGGPTEEGAYTRTLQSGPDCFVRQTGSRRFRPSSGSGPEVELIAAIHIAEAAYYQRLQQQMDRADLVLHEGVASGPRAAGGAEPVSAPQSRPSRNPTYQRMAQLLGLVSQEHAIRYPPPRYQRCDMTLEEMRDLLAKESARDGETARAAAGARAGFDTMRGTLGGKSLRAKLLFFGLEHSAAKRADARLRIAIHNPDPKKPSRLNPRLQQLIIDDRDLHVMDRLRALIATPSGYRRIVLFYGAGHMPGMEKRLLAMGYRPAGPVRWADAVTSRPAAEGLSPSRVARTVAECE